MDNAKSDYECLICGKPVPGYEPEMCCSGHECVCRGQPMNPCTCSEQCSDALFDGIGEDYEQRRVSAGIKRWNQVGGDHG